VGVLCSDLKAWQKRALDMLPAGIELYLLYCPEPKRKRRVRHLLYYVLNVAAIRVPVTKVDLSQFRATHSFRAEQEQNGWSRLPPETLEWVRDKKLGAIVKFGLGLMRVPPDVPVISYHHGDPRKHRGRPAGFYEMLNGELMMGQVVQILGPKLDGGEVLAFAETSIRPYSYRATLRDAYSISPHLLGKALAALREGRRLPLRPTGENHRLPSNQTVARFVLRMLREAVKRVIYGAFIEKRWRVSTTNARHPTEFNSPWHTIELSPPYRFYADPFYHGDAILIEAMNGRTGKGEIIKVVDGTHKQIEGFGGHVSYPASFNGYIVPETAGWGNLAAYEIDDNRAVKVGELDIDEKAILDPTLVKWNGKVYLFGNTRHEGASVLRLWVADDLFGKFEQHPESPIRLGSRGSRMAGELCFWNHRLLRFGQDFRRSYGDGVVTFEIGELTPSLYHEEEIERLAFEHVRGPHTVNFRHGTLLFDWYSEHFSPGAGLRRLLNRL
jgi:hypothetical protein